MQKNVSPTLPCRKASKRQMAHSNEVTHLGELTNRTIYQSKVEPRKPSRGGEGFLSLETSGGTMGPWPDVTGGGACREHLLHASTGGGGRVLTTFKG